MASTQSVAAILIVLLVVASAAAYYVGTTTVSQSTVTKTVQGGGGGTTVTTTTTVSAGTGVQAPFWNQSLVDLAKAEGGTVTCYCVMDSSDWPTMAKVLNQSFPWMKVNYVGLSPGDITTRAITEYNAGKVTADVIVNSIAPIIAVQKSNALAKWNNPMISLMQWSGSTSYYTSYWGLPVVLIWNTNKIKDNTTLPTNWQGLADPKWKGQLVIDNPSILNVAGTVFASLYPAMGNASWTQFMQAVRANNPIITSSAGDSYTDISTGQASIGVGLVNDVIGAASSKPPVGFKYLTPAYAQPEGIAILKGAPHPYSAELFEEWFTSYYGGVALASTGRPSDLGTINAQFFGNYIPASVQLIPVGTGTDLYTNPAKWTGAFKAIFGQ